MKKAVVTGANGFIGSSLVKELVKKKMFVYAVVKNEQSDISNLCELDNINIIYCELDNLSLLKQKIKDSVDIFYHFAWAGTSGEERSDYDLQLKNVRAVCEAVKIAKEIGCRRFIFAGSVMEIESMYYLFGDTCSPGLGYIYSSAKLSADFMAQAIAYNIGLEYSTVIISNIYGPGEKSKRFIYTTLKKLIENEPISFTLGEQLYDFIYISDAVEAIYLVGIKGKANTRYYIGNSQQCQLKQYIIEMKECIDENREITFGVIPFYGPYLNYKEIDTYKLEKEFGFCPKISFKEGIYKTIDWIISEEGRE